MITNPHHKFEALDALRGTAAIMVVCGHLMHMFGFNSLESSSYLAVDLFFVLSGFVVSRAYDNRLSEWMSAAAFAEVRFVRLWPLIALGVTLGLLQVIYLPVLGDVHDKWVVLLPTYILNSFFLPSLTRTDLKIFPLDNPEWSLFYEMVINLLFGTWLFRLYKKPLAVCIFLGLIALVICAKQYHSLNIGWDYCQMFGGSARVWYSFLLGVLMQRTMSSWSPRIPKIRAMWVLVFTIPLLAANFEGWHRTLYDACFVILFSPLLIAIGSTNEPTSPTAQKIAQFLGGISYPLYTIHMPICHALLAISLLTHGNKSIFAAGALVVSILVAFGAKTYFDEPLRRQLDARRQARSLKSRHLFEAPK